jgi:hypothetical protein
MELQSEKVYFLLYKMTIVQVNSVIQKLQRDVSRKTLMVIATFYSRNSVIKPITPTIL